jgi:ribosome-associated protein
VTTPARELESEEANVEIESLIPSGAFIAARAADDKLGQDTIILAMSELFGVVDAFVVTAGRNARQVRTLVEEIEERVKADEQLSPRSVEGLRDASWVLMDYGDFIVHVFLEETRSYYDLEHLWSGAPRLVLESAAAAHP